MKRITIIKIHIFNHLAELTQEEQIHHSVIKYELGYKWVKLFQMPILAGQMVLVVEDLKYGLWILDEVFVAALVDLRELSEEYC